MPFSHQADFADRIGRLEVDQQRARFRRDLGTDIAAQGLPRRSPVGNSQDDGGWFVGLNRNQHSLPSPTTNANSEARQPDEARLTIGPSGLDATAASVITQLESGRTRQLWVE